MTHHQARRGNGGGNGGGTGGGSGGGAASLRVRKNIDALSASELADYEHAVQKLYEISQADPNSLYGYLYYQAMHDDASVGPCEHGIETFLPWHRMLLWVYEDGLRKSDPPRTANVTLPYWDWSQPPSGSRYPKAFEDTSSVLYNLDAGGQPAGDTRNTTPICQPGQGPSSGCQRLPFPRSYLEQDVLSVAQWSSTEESNDPSFGGGSDGKGSCDPGGSGFIGYGVLEQPAHNTMHAGYVAGYMANPSTAAQDPIFWSFHAYIDLLWEQWQQMTGHTVDTCHTCGLCWNTPNPDYPLYKVQDVLNIAGADLGYSYDYTPPPPIADGSPLGIAGTEELFPTHPAKDFALSGVKEPETVRTMEVTIPDTEVSDGKMRMTGVKVATPFTYSGDVYLTPPGVEFNPQDPDFREKYFADLFTVWRAHEGHDEHTGHGHGGHEDHGGHEGHEGHDMGNGTSSTRQIDIVVDLTPELRSLAQSHAGETWTVSVALVVQPDEQASGDMLGAAPSDDSGPRESVDFDSMRLELR